LHCGLKHKSLLCKLLLIASIFSAVTLYQPLTGLASESLAAKKQQKIKVLCYHHIVPEPLSRKIDTIVSASEFEEQMKYLYEHGYYTASIKDIEEFLYNKKQLPENTVLITFDDGYESNYIYAYPVLKKYGFKAVIFPIGSGITENEQSNYSNTLTKLSYRQIQEMALSGLVEFGNHTFDAHDFGKNGKALLQTMTYDEIVNDFKKINMLFEQIGIAPTKSIAYPFGKYSDNAIRAAKDSGHNIGFTVKYGLVYQDSAPMLLNRIIIPSNITIDEFKKLLQDESSPLPEGFENVTLLPLNSHTAYVNGKATPLHAPIKAINGTSLAPLDFFTEQLKWDLMWDPSMFQVAIKQSDSTNVSFCTTAYLVNGTVMVPVKTLAEAMGYEVSWLQDARMVQLKKP